MPERPARAEGRQHGRHPPDGRDTRTQAEWLWRQDPYLRALEHAALRERVYLFWRNFAAH